LSKIAPRLSGEWALLIRFLRATLGINLHKPQLYGSTNIEIVEEGRRYFLHDIFCPFLHIEFKDQNQKRQGSPLSGLESLLRKEILSICGIRPGC
jgi:hypothetical protein